MRVKELHYASFARQNCENRCYCAIIFVWGLTKEKADLCG